MKSTLPLLVTIAMSACRPTAEPASEFDRQPTPQLRFQNGVRSMIEDKDGNFWFGGWNEGLVRWDGERFTDFTREDCLPDPQVRRILEGPDGTIWFETAAGISRYRDGVFSTPTERNYSARFDWKLEASDVWFKEDGGHGFTMLEGRPGAYRFDGSEFWFQAYPIEFDQLASNASYATTDLARGENGRVWFSTYNAVIGYDGNEFTVLDNERLGLNEETGFLHARWVFEDSRGRLWIGNNGIGVFLHEGDTTTHFTQEHHVGRRDHRSGTDMTPQKGDAPPGAPSLHRVFTIAEDRDGNIWFGTVEQGAWRFDGSELRQFDADDGLECGHVNVIYRDRRGDLWVGGDGVFRLDGESFVRVF